MPASVALPAQARGRSLSPALLALALVIASAAAVPATAATAARECLSEAAAATSTIELAGDQSAARRAIAVELSRLDPGASLAAVATISRPADAARALGAAATALASADRASALEAVSTAGRLLTRISDPTRRVAEQRALLDEIAPLREGALAAAPELTPEEAQAAIVSSLARSDPAGALLLVPTSNLPSRFADDALATIAAGLAYTDPEQALTSAASIASATILEETMWRIAERRPPAEAIGVAQRLHDPVVRSAVLSSAAERLAPTDWELALSTAAGVTVAPSSALAELAVVAAPADEQEALSTVRSLPPSARAWALSRIALNCASERPESAEALLSECAPLAGQAPADAARLVLSRMAPRDPDRALRLAQAIPDQEEQESALAVIAGAIAATRPKQACDVVWSISSPRWRSRAAEAVAPQLALTDQESALSLIGLVSDLEEAQRLRADIAGVLAASDPAAAERLLASLPASCYRKEVALEAARRLLQAGGDIKQSLPLALLAGKRDLALRWLLPDLAWSQAESPLHAAESIGDSYLRSLALVDTARRLLNTEARCLPAPDRLALIRPIVEWEGR